MSKEVFSTETDRPNTEESAAEGGRERGRERTA